MLVPLLLRRARLLMAACLLGGLQQRGFCVKEDLRPYEGFIFYLKIYLGVSTWGVILKTKTSLR